MSEKIKVKTPPAVIAKRLILPFSLIVGLILLDAVVKILVRHNMELGQEITVIPSFFYITYVLNSGAAFGSFAGQTLLITIITGVAMPAVIALICFWHGSHRALRSSLALIVAGGLGNFIDRIAYGGKVTDMFELRYFGAEIFGSTSFPIFNVADMALTAGVVLMIVYVLFIYYDKKDPEAVAKHERKMKEKEQRRATTAKVASKKQLDKAAAGVMSVQDYLDLATKNAEPTQSDADAQLPPTEGGGSV